MLWLGHAVSPQIINDLYAIENLDDLDIRIVSSHGIPLSGQR